MSNLENQNQDLQKRIEVLETKIENLSHAVTTLLGFHSPYRNKDIDLFKDFSKPKGTLCQTN